MFDVNTFLSQQTAASLQQQGEPAVSLKDMPTVTNSGLYQYHIKSAFVKESVSPATGIPHSYIELQGVATLDSDPSHCGFLRLFVDIPTGAPDEYKSTPIRFANLIAACKSYNQQGHLFFEQVERTTSDGQRTFVVSPALENKTVYVWIVGKDNKNNRRNMYPYAFMDDQKRSMLEAQNNAPARDFMRLNYIKSEGLSLGLSQNEAKAIQVQNPFRIPGQNVAVNSSVGAYPGVQNTQQAFSPAAPINSYQGMQNAQVSPYQGAPAAQASPYQGVPNTQVSPYQNMQGEQSQQAAFTPVPQQQAFTAAAPGSSNPYAPAVENSGNKDEIPF